MTNKTKIFIAGHNGMLGSALFRKFKDQSMYEVLTVDKKDLDLKSALSNYNKAMNLYNDYKNTFL